MNGDILKRIEEAKELGGRHLILRDGQIGIEIWDKILELDNVRKIQFFNINFIGNIPNIVSKLQYLDEIYFRNCHLKQILDSISKIRQLTKITFFNNDITEFPESLAELLNLVDVNIGYEPIKKIPTFLFQLRNMKRLALNQLNIQDFSSLSKFKQIKKLVLKSKYISTLPESLFQLSQLEYLDVAHSKLTELSLELFTLHNLKTLKLDSNSITTIPTEICQLRNLNEFSINHNPIKYIKFYWIIDKMKPNNILEIFNLNNKSYTIQNNKNHLIFIKSINNYGFIQLRKVKAWYIKRFITNFIQKEGLEVSLCIFGEEKEQKRMLLDLKPAIEKWVAKQTLEKTGRFFLYPIDKSFKPKVHIDYNELVQYKVAGEPLYFDKTTGYKTLVDDLLAYIGEEDIEIKEVWNGADKINKIQIKNFKLFQQLNFNVSERINIILGRNGLGKTSILQAITLGLLPLNNDDKSNQLASYIHFGKKNAVVSIFWGAEYRKAYIFSNELNEEKHTPHPQKLLLSYGVNLNTNPRLDHSDIVKQIVEGNAKRYSTTSIFNDYSTDFYDPIIILQNLYIEYFQSKNKTIAAFVALIKDTINNYLSLIEEKERISLEQNKSNFFFEDINKNQLKTKHLSEGYRDHILLMTDIIVKIIASRNNIFKEVPTPEKLFAEAKGVIIIDEFDRHLHPVWQRRLLWQLKQDFRNIQFILTTHNLFSLQSAEGFKALLLDVKDGTIQVEEKDIEAGLSMETIYNVFFDGQNHVFSYEIEELFREFYDLLEKVEIAQASQTEIERFRKVANQLLQKEVEVQVIIARELRQMERQTGKAFEL